MIRHPDGSVTVTYRFEVTRAKHRRKQLASIAAPHDQETKPPAPLRPVIDASSIPKLTRLLVLGHHFERLVCDGDVRNFAEVARLTGLTKARVTQLVNLTLLAPDIQAEILQLEGDTAAQSRLVERWLRELTAMPEWNEQRRALSVARVQRANQVEQPVDGRRVSDASPRPPTFA